jgi:hypothetical protein
MYLVPVLNAVSAFMGLTLKQAPWSYPLIHLIAASAAGLAVALVCRGIFGRLVRFVPAHDLAVLTE